VEELSGSVLKPPSTFWACTFNLSKVIMGAGMMAIPKAFFLLGWASGTGLLLLIHLLTYLSLGGLIEASEATGIRSYSGLVRTLLGRTQEICLQLAVFLNCYLMNVVFIVVLGDILIGQPPTSPGLIGELFPQAPPLLLSRPFILGLLSLVVLLPLASMRNMERLKAVNIIGVLCNFLFAGVTILLAVAAGQRGALQPFNTWPRWSELGSSPLLIGLGLAAVAPIMLNCDTCHQSLHPLMPMLKPYTPGSMKAVVWWALSVCNVLYVVIAVCSCLTFGESLHGDVLSNVNVEAISPLIGFYPAHIVACVVRFGYLCSLVGSYVLLCFPLRQCLGEVVLSGQEDVERLWLPLTAGLVSTVYCIACFVPSIWGVLGFVGATASTVQAWIMPGLIMWVISQQKLERQKGSLADMAVSARIPSMAEPLLGSAAVRTWWVGSSSESSRLLWVKALGGVLVTILGGLLFINGFLHEFIEQQAGAGGSDDAGEDVGQLLGVWQPLLQRWQHAP
jgi:amino acid permease